MNRVSKARQFKEMHSKGAPVLLYNIWDTGSAKAVEAAGAKAVATSSWAVADTHGFKDGETTPFDLVEANVRRIANATSLPVSVDIEGGYARDPGALTENIGRIIDAGAIGVNFEDQIVGKGGLYDIDEQVRRIHAVRKAGADKGIPLVINARTDLFIQEKDPGKHKNLLSATLDRAAAYAEASADCFFIPFLLDRDLIAELCEAITLPVNVVMTAGMPDIATLIQCGVARISFGARPYMHLMAHLEQQARAVVNNEV